MPRGVTIGVAVELFGIAVALFGLSSLYGYGAGSTVVGNPLIAGLGALIALGGLILHIARI
jgi:hypothetical protein